MCLDSVFTDEEMQKIIDEMPEEAAGVVRVWKVVKKYDAGVVYWSEFRQHTYCGGMNFASPGFIDATIVEFGNYDGEGFLCLRHRRIGRYCAGFHFFFSEEKAVVWAVPSLMTADFALKIITCLVHKDSITAAGTQTNSCVGVASKMFFPTYPETDAKLEDFLAWKAEQKAKEAGVVAESEVAK